MSDGHNTHIAEHAAGGTNGFRIPMLGRLAMFLLSVLMLSAGFTFLSFPFPMYLGLGVALGLEVIFFFWRKQRSGKRRDQTIALQTELDELKRKEFELRFEEAKMKGQLNRWGEDK